MKRLVVLTEIISPYRIPVFNALAKVGGIDLHVIFLAETDPAIRDWLVYKNEIRFSYEVLPSYRKRFGGVNILVNRGVSRTLRSSACDVVICGGYNYVASWEALAWARRNHVPFLLWTESTARDSRRHNRLIETLKRNFIGRCDGFVVPGESSSRYLTHFQISTDRIFTAPNAVDNDLFKRAADAVRMKASEWRSQMGLPKRFFLFVGRIVAEKGVFDLLNAYGGLRPDLRREVGLVFVGDGPARAELERRAGDVAACSVRFTGFVHRESLTGYYALADALILPTHTDTWGLTVNEGMACGLPIVCTDVAGCAPDLVKDGWNGHVIPPFDTRRLAQVLEEFSSCPDTLRAMGERSLSRILGYSPEACANGMAQAALSMQTKYD